MKGSEIHPTHLPRRLADETTPELAAKGGRAFATYIGEKRVAEIHVMPYYQWWWSVSYSRLRPFGDELSVEEQVQKVHEAVQAHKKKRE